MSKTVITNFRLDEETHKAFRIWCINNNTTLADHLRKLIDDTLEGKPYTNVGGKKRPFKKKESELNDWLKEWD